MSEFYVGQKVVCVSDTVRPGYRLATSGMPLVKGRIYAIRDVGTSHLGAPGVRLMGVVHNDFFAGDDLCFGAWRFRPLEPKCAQLFRDIAAGKTIVDDPITEKDLRELIGSGRGFL